MLAAVFKIVTLGLLPLPQALNLVSPSPARAAGLDDFGALEAGRIADLVLVAADTESAPRVERHDVVLKRSEPLCLLGQRRRVLGQREIGPFAVSVVERLTALGLWPMSPLVHLYFEVDADTEEFDLFVGATVSGSPQDEAAWLREYLPAGELLACVIYRGDYPQIDHAGHAGPLAASRWL